MDPTDSPAFPTTVLTIQPILLAGHGVRLEPLCGSHEAELQVAAGDGELWHLPYTSVPRPEETERYIDVALKGQAAGHMLPWVVRLESTGEVVGRTRYHDIVPEVSRVEIGYTWYSSSHHGTHVNPACKFLLLTHAFVGLHCEVVGLRTDDANVRSQRAIAKLGARRDGLIRHVKRRRDGSTGGTVMYSILRSEWPQVERRLRDRLASFVG